MADAIPGLERPGYIQASLRGAVARVLQLS